MASNITAAKNAAKASEQLRKQKKKKWCPIVAPEIFNNRIIGESLVDDASMLMNRTVTVNLMQFLGDMKKQNVSLMFRVKDVKEGKGFAEVVKYEVSNSSIKRLSKRGKDKISDSFVVKTADDKLVRIKPVLITNNSTKGSVLSTLVKDCRAVCKELVNKTKFEQLMLDLVQGNFQKEAKSLLHKTYPLRNFEVRVLTLETKKKKEAIDEQELLKIKALKEQKKKEKLEETDVEDSKPEKSEA